MNRTFMLIFIVLILLGCSKVTNEQELNRIKNNNKNEDIKILDDERAQYKKVEYEFMGRSSQGGVIFAYYENNGVLRYFDIYLFGERGKASYKYNLVNQEQILVLVSNFEYDKSIYEGNTNIVSQSDENFVIEGHRQYKVENGKRVESKDDDALRLYDDAMQVIREGKQ